VTETCISVRGVSKTYAKPTRGGRAGRSLRRLLQLGRAQASDHFFALKDVTFDVRRGDRIGVVGRNGAGKSTLLKILSRVSFPSTGEVLIKGRLTSLLEVGTGFAADLSGRRNIYLNAGLHGLTKTEIDARFDEIVAFSGVGQFIDMPVKHYSSGMYMRLAFSVAAHLDPDILLLDEVLAVGDMAFQQKCLAKVESLTREERTIILVSHSLGHVAQYCSRVIWIDNGEVRFDGDVTEGLHRYREFVAPSGKTSLVERRDRKGTGTVRIVHVAFEDEDGCPLDSLPTGGTVDIVVDYEAAEDLAASSVFVNVIFANEKQQRLFGTPSDIVAPELRMNSGAGRYRCRIPELPLLPGVYGYTLGIMVDQQLVDKIDEAGAIVVVDGDFHKTGRLPIKQFGDTVVHYGWQHETLSTKKLVSAK
jgi:lipopolysaccharide transport system ATP-binding protein